MAKCVSKAKLKYTHIIFGWAVAKFVITFVILFTYIYYYIVVKMVENFYGESDIRI